MMIPLRLRDPADVLQLIETLDLRAEFADKLNPYVQDKYRELWNIVHENPA